MFDWIPLASYTPIYFHVLLVVLLLVFFQSQQWALESKKTRSNGQIIGIFLLVFVVFYMGLRPISGMYFGDMATYNKIFEDYAKGKSITTTKDVLFHSYMWFSAQLMNAKSFFLLCAMLYVIPCYYISKKWFKTYWFYAFLLLVGSFSFWAYGTNGIRNGMATSFFLMALASSRKWVQVLWLVLSVNVHAAMYLPTLGFIITWFYNQPKWFYYFWLASIPLSLALPGTWENLFGSMVEDERAVYFTDDTYADQFSQTGFRWDFLLYSATGVFAGSYYLFKKKIEDRAYIQLFNTFLFANAFWILVIRASFSNRFAYLSWFLLALVICYPWLKFYFEKNQHQKLGWIMMAYFGFTYLMNVILS